MTHFISVDDPPILTSFGELDRDQCLHLLATGGFGRVVGTDCALPAVHPVSFVLDGQEVIFQTTAGSTLAGAVGDVVAFQADDFDHETGVGWTVTGIGKPYAALDSEQPGSIVLAPHLVLLAIPLWRLTGHRLHRSSARE